VLRLPFPAITDAARAYYFYPKFFRIFHSIRFFILFANFILPDFIFYAY